MKTTSMKPSNSLQNNVGQW